jgi:adenylate cyclase
MQAAISGEQLDALVASGLLQPGPMGHDPGDLHRIRLIAAFQAAGVPTEALAAAHAAGTITLEYYPSLHVPSEGVTGIRYGDYARAAGDRASLLPRLYAAFGLAAPSDDTPLAPEEVELLDELSMIASTADADLVLRAVRLLAEGARRAGESVLGLFDEAVQRVAETPRVAAGPAYARLVTPWARLARTTPALQGWLGSRHLSHAIEAYSVRHTEGMLAASGYVAPRPTVPDAIMFVDLSGFTRLTNERGDDAAASMGLRMGEVAADCARRHGGALVKLLGDGALLRFPSTDLAVAAALELLPALLAAGLPPGHVGIDAGNVITRDGDVFGRTVNTAARVSDVAPSGEIYVTEDAASSLDGRELEASGSFGLEGIGSMRLFRVVR